MARGTEAHRLLGMCLLNRVVLATWDISEPKEHSAPHVGLIILEQSPALNRALNRRPREDECHQRQCLLLGVHSQSRHREQSTKGQAGCSDCTASKRQESRPANTPGLAWYAASEAVARRLLQEAAT